MRLEYDSLNYYAPIYPLVFTTRLNWMGDYGGSVDSVTIGYH